MTSRKHTVLFFILILISSLLPTLVLAKHPPPPPPPPPPCGIESAGCYDVNDQRVSFGSLTSDTFGYYYGENVCIPGGCRCTTSKTTSTGKQLDPDSSSGACGCISGADWDVQGQCCGDDPDDCGKIVGGALCTVDQFGRSSRWALANQPVGEILYSGCVDKEYMADGFFWNPCDPAVGIITANNHDYICTSATGQGSWVECCGSTGCNSRTDGQRFTVGESIDFNGQTHYCQIDGKFVTDLDDADETTCVRAGFVWMGTFCCGDEAGEFFNDNRGGCWDGTPVISIDQVETDKVILNFDGKFQGCNDERPGLLDDHSGEQLVFLHTSCELDPSQTFFCSTSNEWRPTNGETKDILKSTPVGFSGGSECCTATQCWDGTQCLGDMSNDPFSPNPLGDFRCIQGNWTLSPIKTNPDGTLSGFCPDASECFVDATSPCLQSGKFNGDDLCFNGEWRTRTTLLALKMLEHAIPGQFVLFCDKEQNTLNEVNYLTSQGTVASSFLAENTNNVCVLKQNSQIIIGASFNTPVTDTAVQALFSVNSCSTARTADGLYRKCDTAGRLWYNQQLESLIFSLNPVLVEDTDLNQLFLDFLKNPLDTLISTLTGTLPQPPVYFVDQSYKDSITSFGRLYISEEGIKKVFGVLDGTDFQNIAIHHTNFVDVDICGIVREYTSQQGDLASGIECSQVGNNFHVLAQGSQITTFKPENVWADLTAKLRIS